MGNKIKKRIFYFDELRAIAILLVILCHTTTIYQPYYYDLSIMSIPSFLNVFGWVGVPIFFMISGALLLNRDYSLKDFFKRRFTRILIPFIFWMIITLAVDYFVLGFSTKQLFMILLGKHRYTWYVWVLIGVYLFLPVLNSFIKEFKLKGVEYFLVIWFITIILNSFGYYPFQNIELSYFARFIGYPILGYYLANKEFNFTKKSISIPLFGLAYVLFTVFNWYCKGHKFLDNSAYLSFNTVFASIALFLFIKSISDYCKENNQSLLSKIHYKIENGNVGKIILSISICSYGMYFMNSLLFGFVKTWHINTFKMMPVIYIAVAVVSWLVVAILNKKPSLRKFIGT